MDLLIQLTSQECETLMTVEKESTMAILATEVRKEKACIFL
jgi:hypothetical protein